ncbi:uncharacterized protein J4E78_004456 [Alternaria triticimaculans]|uniref:uncharacterized protein n=1 Tax=Alternaria triticimaculans TaxID=297637 RepID=UPI0020C3DEAC|nr:uncharacterized protein J4E78_004456 [Alternaria triticimaculans]KAI4661667.1 hypothetical protein J4E78_004456 [Alternaria triticimaculans]
MASTEMDYLHIGMGYRDLNDTSDLVREKEEKRLREERNIDQALDTFELYDDALAIVHINDDTYSYTSASPSLQLLGLTDDDNALQSFFRLLRLHKSIEQETAPRPDIRLLEDGMLNVTPQSEEAKTIYQLNAQSSRLLALTGEIRNQIFAEAMRGFSIFIKSRRVDYGEYTKQELSRITNRIRLLNSSAGTALHETHLEVGPKDFLDVASWHGSKVRITRTNLPGGLKEDSPFVALQSTCRQIYTETALVPFSGINRFWYYNDFALTALKNRITSSQTGAITKLFFHVKAMEYSSRPNDIGDFDLKRVQNLSTLTGLKYIHIAVVVGTSSKSSFRPSEIAALKRIEAGLGPRLLKFAPKDVELAFELHRLE